jgi:hypothetical protein
MLGAGREPDTHSCHLAAAIASIDPVTGELVPLFNPRTQKWNDHFTVVGGKIVPRTSVGRVTEQLLKLNLPLRLEVRETLVKTGRYP